MLDSVPFDLRRFQYLLGTPCDCQTLTFTDEGGGRNCNLRCCQRCWEIGMMMSVQARRAQQDAEVCALQLEMDGIFEPSAPPSAQSFPGQP